MQRVIVMLVMSVVLTGCGGSGGIMGRMFPSPTPISRFSRAYTLCLKDIPMNVLYARPAFGDNGERGYEITIRLDDNEDTSFRVAACILNQMEVPLYVTDAITTTQGDGIHQQQANDLDITWSIEYRRLTITVIDLKK